MQITSRITAVRRRPNTPSGNPVIVVEWDDPNLPTGRQWARTAPDSTVAHRISHEDVGKILTLVLRDGEIVDVIVPKGHLR